MMKYLLIFILVTLNISSLRLFTDGDKIDLQKNCIIQQPPKDNIIDEIREWGKDALAQKESNIAKITILKDIRKNLVAMNDSIIKKSEYVKAIEKSIEKSDIFYKSFFSHNFDPELCVYSDLRIEYLNWTDYKKLIIPELNDYYLADSLYTEMYGMNLRLIDEKIGILEDQNKKIREIAEIVIEESRVKLEYFASN